MSAFIDKQLRQEEPSGKSEMQHKREQTPVREMYKQNHSRALLSAQTLGQM